MKDRAAGTIRMDAGPANVWPDAEIRWSHHPMSGRESGRGHRLTRGRPPTLERLDPRLLLSAGIGPSIGSFLAPGTTIPKVPGTSAIVGPLTAVDSLLSNELGTAMSNVEAVSQAQMPSATNLVATKVVSQPLIRSLLSRQDTYTLLNSALTDLGGAAGDSYTATGPILASALSTATKQTGPNAPRDVPGLRLVQALARNHNFAGSEASSILLAFHIAVERQVLTLDSQQEALVTAGYAQFAANVQALNAAGAFTPSTPPAATSLPKGPLTGTIEVSLGAFRGLSSVYPSQSGLPLPGIGNFDGRIDEGFVIDRKGNFGIAITARGPLSGVPKGVASSNVIGGDIRIEVSNDTSLAALDGLSQAEGLTQGGGRSGGLEADKTSSGVSTFAASVGYGSGLEFGTGMAYTEVIPLGNAFALIPAYPKP
jgi:hypothetical protein